MTTFVVERSSNWSAERAWARLTDWVAHGELVPFTTVTYATPTRVGVGTQFVARTSVGPVGFDDPMEVTYWQPPLADTSGRCRMVKRGRLVRGWAVLTVTPTPEGCLVTWTEDIRIRFVGPLLSVPVGIVAPRVFGRLVDGLLAT
ncbi:MAG TPA: SRPBCC family protein [Nocardioidaceae bacterium]|nr:SRPBCC family protein [Nocardioidaceae bacterium]